MAELEALDGSSLAIAAKTVLLTFPTEGNPRSEFMQAVTTEMTSLGSPLAGYRDIKSGPVLTISRSQLAREYLETPFDWVWMVDSDIVFTPRTLGSLLAAADPMTRPIVGAVYYGMMQGRRLPVMYFANRTDPQPGYPDGKFTFSPLSKWPKGELLKVDATGAGCLLVHRSVFKRISDADPDHDGLWFAEIVIDQTIFGEDMSFCLRAAMAGIPVFVHTGVTVGHMKTIMLGKPRP